MKSAEGAPRDLVLVGGGHAHVQVLRRFAMEPPRATRVTVVLDTPIAVYSGMVPGFVAGQYAAHELEIDVVPLARRAGARVVLARAVGLDPAARRITVDGRASISYDVASFDIGSTVAGTDLPGVRQLALPTRPIGRLVDLVEEEITAARRRAGEGAFRVVVVGAGVGGVELAFTLDTRLRAEGLAQATITVLQSGPRVLPGSPASLVSRVERQARRRGIEICCGVDVVGALPAAGGRACGGAAAKRQVEPVPPARSGAGGRSGRVALADGDEIAFDLLVWVTGAVGQPLFRDSGLSVDDRGFVLVRPTLQVEGYDDVFAVGDCATLVEHAATPKAGVYAVRQGPYLTDNLRALLEGGELRRYQPQRDFLALLNLGDGSALGTKWGASFEGRWVMRLKDWIDRRFMRRFQVLDLNGEPAPEFPAMEGDMEMLCGGCAAKIGQTVLERALARVGAGASSGADDSAVILGFEHADDAAAVRTPRGDVLTSTIDVFTAFTDDPWLVGKVAAINAASDLLAKGVAPRYALALVAVPEEAGGEEAEEVLYQALAGARAAFDELGVTLLGGHTTTAAKLMVGFTVDGFAEDERKLLRIDCLRVGQRLVLSKALGTGVLFHADMKGLARGRWLEEALASVTRSNAGALAVLRAAGVEAVTDVTGFGLVGHLGGMLRASGVSARVELEAIPALPGALELLGRGLRSTFHAENERARRGIAIPAAAARDPRLALLFDPQTSGGLLFGVDQAQASAVATELRAQGPAAIIGEVIGRRDDGVLVEVL
ncbi:MAG TPA: selenide, water dikinase SelD [Thermoanaerobaculia bacterium]|nr:selenide, water dikinase SelD [Thermoanaerobaculia bacterium]